MIVTEGGRFCGYGLYLLKGKPVFLYNLLALVRFRWDGQEALAPKTIRSSSKADAGRLGYGRFAATRHGAPSSRPERSSARVPAL